MHNEKENTNNVTYKGYACLIIVGSRFDDWIYWTSQLKLHLIMTTHTWNSLITDLSLNFFGFSVWSPVSRLLLLSTTHYYV
jgi:hypothetical protein